MDSAWANVWVSVSIALFAFASWLTSRRMAAANEILTRIEESRWADESESRRRRLLYVRAVPVGPPTQGLYRIELANPGRNVVTVTSVEWTAHDGFSHSWQSPLGTQTFIEAAAGQTASSRFDGLRLVPENNVAITPGHVEPIYVRAKSQFRGYLVRFDFHFAGPGMEDLRVMDYVVSHAGLAWSIRRKGAAPPNPLEEESQRYKFHKMDPERRAALRKAGAKMPSDEELSTFWVDDYERALKGLGKTGR